MKLKYTKMAALVTGLITFGSLAGGANGAVLTFSGVTDNSGFFVAGNEASVGSMFNYFVDIEPTAIASEYSIEGMRFSIETGSYSSISAWTTNLKATVSGNTLTLATNPRLSIDRDSKEQFVIGTLSATAVGADVTDPMSWNGAIFTGDFIFRGSSGGNVDGFSSRSLFESSATLAVSSSSVPEPSSALLLVFGMVGSLCRRRRN